MLNRLVSELLSAPGRWRRAIRGAGITAGGAALMAALQINNPLGVTLLYNFGAPESAFSFASGLGFLIGASLLQSLSLAIGGALITWPLAHLGTFMALSIITSYLIYASPHLGRLWVWAQVPLLTGFYLMVLQPETVAADNAQIFAGLAVAVGLIWLCNRVIWPCSPAQTLRESVSAMMGQARERLHRLIASAPGDPPAIDDTHLPMPPRLGYHLTLLNMAMRQAETLGEAAELLSRVITAERIRYAVVHLEDGVVMRNGQPFVAGAMRELAEIGRTVERLIEEHGGSPTSLDDGAGEAVNAEILTKRIERLAVMDPSSAAIAQPLACLAQILQSNLSERPPDLMPWPSARLRPNPVIERFLLRFSLRHTLALTIAFLIGLWDNSPALHAAIWLLLLGGPPSHGATTRKFTVRAIGSGAALSLAAIATIVLAPNFGSLPGYAAAIFAGTLPLAYLAESGGILSYLAIGGTAFVIAFSGPGPRPELVGSIWTIWGITLGMVIRAVLSSIWREIPGRTLAEQFQAPLEALIGLASASTDQADRGQYSEWAAELLTGLARILAVAGDAQLEGSSSAINPASLITVLDILAKSGFLLINLGLNINAPDRPLLSSYTNTTIAGLRKLYSSWLNYLAEMTASGAIAAAPLRAMITTIGGLKPPDSMLARKELESNLDPAANQDQIAIMLRRLIELTHQVEREFTHIARIEQMA